MARSYFTKPGPRKGHELELGMGMGDLVMGSIPIFLSWSMSVLNRILPDSAALHLSPGADPRFSNEVCN